MTLQQEYSVLEQESYHNEQHQWQGPLYDHLIRYLQDVAQIDRIRLRRRFCIQDAAMFQNH